MSFNTVAVLTKTFYPIAAILTVLGGPSSIAGMGFLLVLVDVLKRLFGELRPDRSDRRSFPSGHSSTAWYLAYTFGWNIVVVAWALAVSISRVILKRHFIHDVIAGLVLGTTVAYITKRVVEKHFPSLQDNMIAYLKKITETK